jgi:hypothetical protein
MAVHCGHPALRALRWRRCGVIEPHVARVLVVSVRAPVRGSIEPTRRRSREQSLRRP